MLSTCNKQAYRYMLPLLEDFVSYLRTALKEYKVAIILIAALSLLAMSSLFLYSAAYILEGFPAIFQNNIFSPYHGGFLEMFGYLMIGIASALFFKMGFKKPYEYLRYYGLIFIMVLIDDALEMHEFISKLYRYKFGTSVDLDDLLGFLTLGIFVMAIWGYAWVKTPKTQHHVNISGIISILLGALIFFGVIVDAAYTYLIHNHDFSKSIGGILEDGSELIIMSILAVTTIGMNKKLFNQ